VKEKSLRPWAKTIAKFLGSNAVVTSYSRIDHFLIFNESGCWSPRELVIKKLQSLSEFIGFEVRGSDYVFDIASRLREGI